ncbi:MAG TPA: hypothetical protein VJ124_05785 [Pyrinomonadaceae bacterium]|nr:hypothetical protein [Pyrinomonadaceae bacterium]
MIAQTDGVHEMLPAKLRPVAGPPTELSVVRYIEMQHTPPLVAQDYQTE